MIWFGNRERRIAMNELLDEKVIEQRGPWRRVRRWWRGIHPDRGIISIGWSGLETVEERECFTPSHVIAISWPAGTGPGLAA